MLHLQWSRRCGGAFRAVIVLALLALVPHPARATDWQLVMVEQAGCSYCARWHAEVGPEYPLTPEGRFAPLRPVNLRALPDDLSFATRPVYTPTFVLMADGVEVGRLEGYPGEDFFWGLIGRLLQRGDAAWATQDAGG